MNTYPLARACAPTAALFITLWYFHRRWWTRPLALIGALLLAPIAITALT